MSVSHFAFTKEKWTTEHFIMNSYELLWSKLSHNIYAESIFSEYKSDSRFLLFFFLVATGNNFLVHAKHNGRLIT